ncbi:unnamed protein product [Urochloa decumbens]|uniref:Protein kinase domain-containing protein n=1 Tax=Urochloa decumbens TaxID=240449 RepID=A0ABC9BEN1_9POAL
MQLAYKDRERETDQNEQSQTPVCLTMSPALLVLAVLAVASPAASLIGKPGCQTRCGDVDVPYPFGIGTGTGGVNCSLPGFEIGCASTGSGSTVAPILAGTDIAVLNLSVMPRPEARVLLPVAWQCFNSTGDNTGYSYSMVRFNPAGVYRISDTRNELFVLGCNTLIYTNSGPPGRYGNTFYTGCMTFCNDSQSAQDGKCAGVGCCHVDIPPELTDNWMQFGDTSIWSHEDQEFCPCDYGFIVEKGYYLFRASDLTMPVNRTMPLRLDWAIRSGGNSSSSSMSCTAAKNKPQYACVSGHSECVDSTNGPGYFCNCTQGYEGNPYIVGGCKNIDECTRPTEYPCHGVCRDIEGSYECKCRAGYQNNGDPKEQPCSPKFPLAAQLALGITLGVSLLIVATLLTLMVIHKRRMNEYFKKNGGSVLQKVESIKIFTKDELNKITKNNSEVLGQGGFGKVYKGTLEDSSMVAVKSSIEVNEERKEDFTNEVTIQSQMIHRNILKLVGCCLEVDVPMLVYEFAAKGSLQDVLHREGADRLPIPLDLRLEIAIGSAEGLRYMHSLTNHTIRHGDVKPDNILIDDHWIPKISDFGLSKLLKVDNHIATMVIGCMSYLDPVFMKTGLLTQKSDVYSFGAVLLELITRKKIVYGKNNSLIIEFCRLYEKEGSGRAMFDKDIATEENIFILEEIGKLAIECLKDDVNDRPDMNEVAEQLVMLRRDRKYGKAQNRSPRSFEGIAITSDSPRSFATDTTSSSAATPLPSATPSREFPDM